MTTSTGFPNRLDREQVWRRLADLAADGFWTYHLGLPTGAIAHEARRSPVLNPYSLAMQEAVIGGLGTIIGALIGAWAATKARTPTKAHVMLVDVALVEPRNLEPAERASLGQPLPELIIDVKLLNNGGQPAYVHALKLELSEIIYHTGTEMPRLRDPSEDILSRANLTEWSARYGAYVRAEQLIRQLPKEVLVPIPLSQELKPSSVDRVCLDWSPSLSTSQWPAVASFKARVTVVYNATRVAAFNETLQSPVLFYPRRAAINYLRSELGKLLAQCQEAWTLQELEALRSRGLSSESPRLLKWRGREMEPLEAVRSCLDAHERHLRELVDVYATAGGNESDQAPQIEEEIAAIPDLRDALGVSGGSGS
ncbi:hypothetical protein [Streptomyces sp. MP131-18]|uniref:hypothetical protein n=1 Tax=Streptomyces sp. MP131-18 TaxID=1857892 RepID=UPI0009C59CC6|nr:hypothetical protein [Streptomyces sp. MP131-18]ONK13132.1 hypothetical protein STBA_38940 [Streptomyces sp. MP131-18]